MEVQNSTRNPPHTVSATGPSRLSCPASDDARLRRTLIGGVAVRSRMLVPCEEARLALEGSMRVLSPAIELLGLSLMVGSACTAARGRRADLDQLRACITVAA